MYNEKIEGLIKAALADGVLTEKEKQVLFKRAQEQGIDLDEFEMVLDARLVELQKEEKEKAQKSAPKSDKFGDVRKCPACGALVPALAVSCAECGYEFSGIEASSSAQILSKKIAEIKETGAAKKLEISLKYSMLKRESLYSEIDSDIREQISSLVENFPIPNTKKDLLDFIFFLKENTSYVYKKKLNECISRAKILFPNDPLFKQAIEQVNEKKKKEKKEQITGCCGTIIVFTLLILLALFFL